MGNTRTIESVVTGQQVTDGAGVRITRILSQAHQRRLDPFLMLDNFRSDDPKDYIAGFPNHPHRGFETVTYMIAGRMRHSDNAGHEGLLENGGIQWMTAGRGIIHSEMPEQEDGAMEGFQLWLNLPAADKMATPWYRNFQTDDIPEYTTPEGVRVRVIAGESQSMQGAVTRPITEPLYLDIHLPPGARFEQSLRREDNAFVVVYRGEVGIGGRRLRERQMAILANSPEANRVIIETDVDAKAILVAGKPLNEPIAQHGPFVMNSHEQIVAAVRDFQAGRF